MYVKHPSFGARLILCLTHGWGKMLWSFTVTNNVVKL